MHRWQASAHGASSMAKISSSWLPVAIGSWGGYQRMFTTYRLVWSILYVFFCILYMSTIKMIYIYVYVCNNYIYIHEQKSNLQIQTSNIFLAPFSRGAFNNRSRHVSVVVCWWRPLTSKSWATTVTHLHLGNGGKVVVILIPSECPFFLCRSDVFDVKYGHNDLCSYKKRCLVSKYWLDCRRIKWQSTGTMGNTWKTKNWLAWLKPYFRVSLEGMGFRENWKQLWREAFG